MDDVRTCFFAYQKKHDLSLAFSVIMASLNLIDMR